MTGYIGVHVGAGRHSKSLESKYEQLCQRASKHGVDILAKGGNAFDAVVEATVVLEDSLLTNAGFGSNLTWDGTVECDASVMDGARLTFGACGAVPGVKNPILLAKHICDQQQVPLALGRVPPCLLAGEGAQRYAMDHNIPTVDSSSLISTSALKSYKHARRKLIRYEEHVKKKMKPESPTLHKERLDTVGAVCVDSVGNIAVACSSGGILLKYPGRIGQAAVQGAGCWADGTVGVVTTGCGEHLIATNLAKEAARNIHSSNCPTSALQTTFKDGFLGTESPLLRNIQEKLAGLLVIQVCDGRGELLYAHTTESMCIGYMSTKHKKPKSRMSRLPEGTKQGLSVVIEGVCF